MAVWTSAWLHGAAASDDVLDALQPWAEQQQVRAATDELSTWLELPGPRETPASTGALLAALRKAGAATADLVLPVPGDVRGLDGATDFAKQAMRSGEATVLPDAGLGIVPQRIAEEIGRASCRERASLSEVGLSAEERSGTRQSVEEC